MLFDQCTVFVMASFILLQVLVKQYIITKLVSLKALSTSDVAF